jgi:hypothetical protein
LVWAIAAVSAGLSEAETVTVNRQDSGSSPSRVQFQFF